MRKALTQKSTQRLIPCENFRIKILASALNDLPELLTDLCYRGRCHMGWQTMDTEWILDIRETQEYEQNSAAF
jgi:hypothetical protein